MRLLLALVLCGMMAGAAWDGQVKFDLKDGTTTTVTVPDEVLKAWGDYSKKMSKDQKEDQLILVTFISGYSAGARDAYLDAQHMLKKAFKKP